MASKGSTDKFLLMSIGSKLQSILSKYLNTILKFKIMLVCSVTFEPLAMGDCALKRVVIPPQYFGGKSA